MLLITPRFGLFEAAGWVNEVLSRTEEKNQELPGPYAACCGAVELKDHVRAVIQGLRRVGSQSMFPRTRIRFLYCPFIVLSCPRRDSARICKTMIAIAWVCSQATLQYDTPWHAVASNW